MALLYSNHGYILEHQRKCHYNSCKWLILCSASFFPTFSLCFTSNVGGSQTTGNSISCSNSETFRNSSTDLLMHQPIKIKIHKYATLRSQIFILSWQSCLTILSIAYPSNIFSLQAKENKTFKSYFKVKIPLWVKRS